MCFWDVVNLIDPLTVDVSFDNDETEIIGRNIFSLQVVCQVLKCAFVGLDAVLDWPVSFKMGFGGEYFRFYEAHIAV